MLLCILYTINTLETNFEHTELDPFITVQGNTMHTFISQFYRTHLTTFFFLLEFSTLNTFKSKADI